MCLTLLYVLFLFDMKLKNRKKEHVLNLIEKKKKNVNMFSFNWKIFIKRLECKLTFFDKKRLNICNFKDLLNQKYNNYKEC